MAESTKVAFSLELFEAHQVVDLNAREELDKAKKNLKEFLDARVS
jgi:hypothetical protein